MAPPLEGGHNPGLDAIADQLNELADIIRQPDSRLAPTFTNVGRYSGRERYLSIAQRLYQMRRRRAPIFGSGELFGEPAWDILLDLYIAYALGSSVSVTSACIGAAVPATTALRHLGQLHDEGLVVREHDTQDQRRTHVRLSAAGINRMEAYFNEISGAERDGPIQAASTAMIRNPS